LLLFFDYSACMHCFACFGVQGWGWMDWRWDAGMEGGREKLVVRVRVCVLAEQSSVRLQ